MEAKRIQEHIPDDFIQLSKDYIGEEIFNHSNSPLVFVTTRGIILKYNRAFKGLSLSKSSELEKLNLLDFFGDTSRVAFKEMLGWIAKKDSEINKQLILVNNATEKTIFDVTIKSIGSAKQRLGLVIFEPAMSRDSEIKSSGKLSQLFIAISDNLKEGIYRNSREEGMIYVNKSFVELFGYQSVKEVLNVSPAKFYADNADRSRIAKVLREADYLTNETILFRRKDGSTFWGLVNCSVTREYNGTTYYDGAIIDITEQKDAENILQQKNRELKKINAQMDRFLYSAYHDIRSPIASVLGLTNIMRMELQDEQMLSYLDKIDESLNKLDYFVNDIKYFSQNARQHITSKKIDFPALVNEVWKKFKYQHDLIELQLKIDDDKFFFSDSSRIMLILENLFKNCIQFSDKTKNEHYIKVNVHLSYDKATIEVIDNGIGIGKQHLDKVFNMFYRGSESSKGSGLGLYITKETVLKLNGNISIESEVGLGTIVNVEIPNDKKGRLMTRKFLLQSR
ncbi:PAS domain-containing sensor histidine kinase [Fulvivirga lutea]|uniref:histidine kinase n=1 Tax=Fulvivirga lutea TaxID=2810512 RepID=A0A974WH38_9BACT|nr:ATP-binding protein [Fulvivirga lutea]QSE97583.1 PAS domain S-box protein [Fulvivirga lutea]